MNGEARVLLAEILDTMTKHILLSSDDILNFKEQDGLRDNVAKLREILTIQGGSL